MENKNYNRGEIFALLSVVIFFIVAAYFAREYEEAIKHTVENTGNFGWILYVFIVFIAIVIAPISATPLLPVAAALWGPAQAAFLSIAGWTLGAVVAFIIARRYSRSLVTRLVLIEKAREIADRLPERNLFFAVIFFRMIIPVDILSYALGLFTDMPLWLYSVATLIGVTPFAFVFAYASTLPIVYQALAGALAVLIIGIGYARRKT